MRNFDCIGAGGVLEGLSDDQGVLFGVEVGHEGDAGGRSFIAQAVGYDDYSVCVDDCPTEALCLD